MLPLLWNRCLPFSFYPNVQSADCTEYTLNRLPVHHRAKHRDAHNLKALINLKCMLLDGEMKPTHTWLCKLLQRRSQSPNRTQTGPAYHDTTVASADRAENTPGEQRNISAFKRWRRLLPPTSSWSLVITGLQGLSELDCHQGNAATDWRHTQTEEEWWNLVIPITGA